MKKIISFAVMGLLSMPFIHAQVGELEVVADEPDVEINNVSAEIVDVQPVVPKDTATIESLNTRDSLVPEVAIPEVRLISLGVTAGLNMAGYRTNMEGGGMRLGGQVGVNMEFPIGQYLAIQPEMILSLRGGKYDYAGVYGVKEPGESLLYMDVPINVKFSKRMGKGRPFISVAPMFSFGIYGSSTYEGVGPDGSATETKISVFQCDPELEQEDAAYNNFDFGFCFKLGYDTDDFWSISAGYSIGLTEMYNVSAEEEKFMKKHGGEEPSLKNHNIFVTVGYRW